MGRAVVAGARVTATDVARSATGSVDWRAIEVAAFTGQRELQDVIDPREQHHRVDRVRRTLLYTVMGIGVVLLFAVILAPAFAVSTVIWGWFGPDRPGPTVTVPIAGVLFLLTGVVQVIECVIWIRSGRQAEHTFRWHAAVTAALGIATIVVALAMMALDGSLELWPWCLVIAAPSIFAILFLRGQVRGSTPAPASGDRSQEEIAAALAARIPTARRERIRADIVHALDELEARRVVDAETLHAAREAPLGTIAFRLDPLPPEETAESATSVEGD